MRLLAPAKINLHLRVGRRRDDGFHPLLTWMCTVGLFDTLTLEAAPERTSATPPAAGRAGGLAGAAPGSGIWFDCDRADLPRDEGNLVVRIAKAFEAELLADSGRTAAGATGSGAPAGGRGGGSNSAGAAPLVAP